MCHLVTLLVALATLIAAPRGLAGEPTLVVIVHPSRVEPLTTADVARIFLRKRRFWADGAPIIPLNGEVESAARQLFTARVLGGDGSYLVQYWNEQYFVGVFPPAVLSSSAAVRRYVATDHDAIGYVEAEEADDSVRVALRLE
jgi:ABC-type phosphate transport system substrate-binding protein